MYEFDYLIFIGRFQPFHKGHRYIVQQALGMSENLIFVIGSHDKARSIRNPFTTQERIQIIKAGIEDLPHHYCLEKDPLKVEMPRVHFAPQHDYTYNDDRWIASIQASVNTIIHRGFNPKPIRIGIVGYDKDHSTYYLKKFPQWEFVEIKPLAPKFCATMFRNAMFNTQNTVPEAWYINDAHKVAILKTDSWNVVEEFEYIADYKSQWENVPYPPMFVTVDAVVTNAGHVLLIERKDAPGIGLWALPGGFIESTETLEQAVIRELYEETRLQVPKAVIKGAIAAQRTFDDPHRSERGRTITEAYLIKLNENGLPKVKGSTDAEAAFWVPFAEVVRNRANFFEDHYHIIEAMVGL